LINSDGLRTPFEVDIQNHYTTGLNINVPNKKGVYKIVVDVVCENKRWWNTETQFFLDVQ
jgi:hypothetical protein